MVVGVGQVFRHGLPGLGHNRALPRAGMRLVEPVGAPQVDDIALAEPTLAQVPNGGLWANVEHREALLWWHFQFEWSRIAPRLTFRGERRGVKWWVVEGYYERLLRDAGRRGRSRGRCAGVGIALGVWQAGGRAGGVITCGQSDGLNGLKPQRRSTRATQRTYPPKILLRPTQVSGLRVGSKKPASEPPRDASGVVAGAGENRGNHPLAPPPRLGLRSSQQGPVPFEAGLP